MRTVLGKKYIIKDRCTSCGLCVSRICPANAILFPPGKPYPLFDEGKCAGCQGCVSLCPSLAFETKKTLNKIPYLIYRDYKLRDLRDI